MNEEEMTAALAQRGVLTRYAYGQLLALHQGEWIEASRVPLATGREEGVSMDLSWDEAYQRYDEMLNEVYGPVKLGDQDYDAARVLRQVDPVRYRTGFGDWADAQGIDTDELVGPDRNEP